MNKIDSDATWQFILQRLTQYTLLLLHPSGRPVPHLEPNLQDVQCV